MAITFQNQDMHFKLSAPLRTKRWIKKIIELEKKQPGQINYMFMSDESLLRNNKQFLNHSTLTDIITFDYREGKKISGDILISVERVIENAEKFKVAFEVELQRVMIHGVLHLCGYGDKSKSAKEVMRKKEDWALKKF